MSGKTRGVFGRLWGKRSEEPAASEDAAEDNARQQETDAAHEQQPPSGSTSPSAEQVAAPLEETAASEIAAPASAVDAPIAAEPLQPAVSPSEPQAEIDEAPAKGGWFSRLKQGLGKTSAKLSDGITGIFTRKKLEAATLEELEDVLIEADLGVGTAENIIETLRKGRYEKGISADDVRSVLQAEVARVLTPVAKPLVIDATHKPHVVLMVGVNGTGKTTTIGKLSSKFRAEGKSVMLAAADTFRAAAIDQLKVWGERTGTTVISGAVGADAAGLVYDALARARQEGVDVLLVDTAGRLQNKEGLMDELSKVVRVVRKLDDSAPHDVLLVLDATTGQNAMSQVDVFRQRAGVTGLIMTKLDGTARGGILVAISAKHALPVHAIGVGEGVNDLQPFDAGEFARAIAGND
ncbi:Signal recognition particle receptor protein FtsY (alpha subunit) [Hyphomicrobium sulfonivorans]|uniref:Signal recognition particle receptor FtsY n=1 Tax=Hyphomicrobium sulfonivorans TaxID=121290 RepID=A0A120CUI7_HYPSL|nr:signal recognition particle-docking protein FtsY [Hyphomicrobium sulfonivorans]KWT66312.1 Signal recognition particle receptor protein FtsY (alpha subunit) [Hyphomicrobium sulfonivorans]